MIIPYPRGLKNPDGSWKHKPVHSVLGWKMRLNWFETHHGYYGLVMIALGVPCVANWLTHPLLHFAGIFLGILLIAVGWILFHDDFIDQHHRQVMEYDPLYHSEIHVWYRETLYQYAIIKKLNIWADKIFGWFK